MNKLNKNDELSHIVESFSKSDELLQSLYKELETLSEVANLLSSHEKTAKDIAKGFSQVEQSLQKQEALLQKSSQSLLQAIQQSQEFLNDFQKNVDKVSTEQNKFFQKQETIIEKSIQDFLDTIQQNQQFLLKTQKDLESRKVTYFELLQDLDKAFQKYYDHFASFSQKIDKIDKTIKTFQEIFEDEIEARKDLFADIRKLKETQIELSVENKKLQKSLKDNSTVLSIIAILLEIIIIIVFARLF